MFAVIRGNAEGWGSTLIVSLLTAAVVLLVIFVISQAVQDNAMLDLSLFRNPTFDGAAIVAFAVSGSMFAMFLYLTLYLQTDLGLSPLQTGLRFLPVTVVSFFVAMLSGNLSTRVPVRLLLSLGLLLVGGGLLLMRGLRGNSEWTALLPGFLLAGAGVGMINPALASTAIGVVPPQRSGMASGINSTFRQVGIATGIAVLGAVFESSISSSLAPRLAGSPVAGHAHDLARAVAGGGAQGAIAGVPAPQRAQTTIGIHNAFASAMNDILLVAATLALAGAVLALALIRTRDFVSHTPTPEPAAA